jgi:membrane-bound lytic murein transglycosylase A
LQCSCSNGRRYASLGRELVKDGKLGSDEVSIPAIRAYFDAHPEKLDEYLFRNESYVFFDETTDPPRGCAGTFVTPGRSIATDKRIFPAGAVGFVVVPLPIVERGRVVRTEIRARFVVDDDTGGAIRGPGRVDLYCGEDEAAEVVAGMLRNEGELYYLLKKKP